MPAEVTRFQGPGTSGSYSYTTVGNAEDLSSILINIDPNITKFLQAFGDAEPATATDFMWSTERLRPPQDNAHLEYEEYTYNEVDSQELLRNYIQHFQNTGKMSDTANKIKKIWKRGGDEFNAAVDHAMKGQARDIEFMLVSSASANAESGTTPARSGGVPYFMNLNEEAATVDTSTGVVTLTNVNGTTHTSDLKTGDFVYFTATTMPTGLTANKCYYIKLTTAGATNHNAFNVYNSLEDAVGGSGTAIVPSTAGTALKVVRRNVVKLDGNTEFSLANINKVLEMVYRRGGDANQAYMSLAKKQKFSELVNAGLQVVRSVNEMAQRNDAATVYESDFGTITARGHQMYPDNRIDILDMQYWDLKWLFKTHEVAGLAKTGSYEKFVIESALGLKATAPMASGAIINIKNS